MARAPWLPVQCQTNMVPADSCVSYVIRKGFPRKFTVGDVALLAELDALHGTLSGPATKCLLQRAVRRFGDLRYERLASISVAHLYNLRRARGYAVRRRHWTKTKGQSVAIGVHRAPTPEGRPGFIRIDSVHQGDQDGAMRWSVLKVHLLPASP